MSAHYTHFSNVSQNIQRERYYKMSYKLLDLFCGAGGCSEGYKLAGFEITGVDIEPQNKYPYRFIQSDAFAFLKTSGHLFDAVHASPPCQGYSHLTPKKCRSNHPLLISTIRDALVANNKPYVIENVAGAKSQLHNPTMLCGSMFSLRCFRHRFFESSFPFQPPAACNHNFVPLLVTTASKASRALRKKLGMPPKTVLNAPLAYGINWMDFRGLKEAVPPAYTRYIGGQLINYLESLNSSAKCGIKTTAHLSDVVFNFLGF